MRILALIAVLAGAAAGACSSTGESCADTPTAVERYVLVDASADGWLDAGVPIDCDAYCEAGVTTCRRGQVDRSASVECFFPGRFCAD